MPDPSEPQPNPRVHPQGGPAVPPGPPPQVPESHPHSGQPQPIRPAPAPEPSRTAGPNLKPAAAAAGVATVALAGGIAAVALTSGSSAADGGASGPVMPTGPVSTGTDVTGGSGSGGTGSTSQGSTAGTGAVSSSSIAGDWTGSIDGGGTPVGLRLTLDSGDPAAVTGKMMFADPDTKAWAPAGTLTGALDGTTLKLQSNSDAALTLTVSGDSLTGTGELTRKDNPFPVKVTLTRG